jgi:hypothetical protein
VNGDNYSNSYKENTEKRLLYTEGYLNHNSDHMDKEAFQNAKAKQERRKEQLDSMNLNKNSTWNRPHKSIEAGSQVFFIHDKRKFAKRTFYYT